MRILSFNPKIIQTMFLAGVCCAAVLSAGQVAQAETVFSASDQDASLAQLKTGEQRTIEDRSGNIKFAGQDIALNGFGGVLGYSSDVAYVVTIAGSATLDNKTARPGKILLIPPFGQKVMVQRYDAKRLSESWTKNGRSPSPQLVAELDRLADGQATGIFLGRLGRTNFNVTTSGSAAREVARRSVVGGNVVRDLRFASVETQSEFDRKVIGRFLEALVAGNSDTVAELMDPVPFGENVNGNAGQARRQMAAMLLRQRNWAAILGTSPQASIDDQGRWIVAGPENRVIVSLRSAPGFTFIKSIRAEEG